MTEPSDEGPIVLLDPDEERALAGALRAAWDPAPLDPERHEAMIDLALGDPLAPPSAEEIAESERLRRALEREDRHPDADLARALAAAAAPPGLGAEASRRLVAAALGRPRRRPSVVYASIGAAFAGALAAAAAAIFVVRPEDRAEPAAAVATPAPLSRSRSAAPLFAERFEARAASARIDRIALTRARELRENRYAGWGVR